MTVIPPDSTLSRIFQDFGFSEAEATLLRDQVKPVFDLNKIVAGRELRLTADESGRILSLEYDISASEYLEAQREGEGFRAEVKSLPVEQEIALLSGVVEDSLIAAFSDREEQDVLALEFAEIFSWDIDFYIDPRQGDTFRLLVEKKFREGRFVGYGNILAAEYGNAGKRIRAFSFTSPKTGRTDFFDAEGNSLRKEFLKSPLKYGRITSRFTSRRYHPLHKVYRSHYGIDYAAPLGTPVRATADGTVQSMGWKGAAGRMVTIRHRGGYETIYLHLSRFEEGIAPGMKVSCGHVIGYVGASGEATGPHLDYRVLYHGKYINPLGHRFQPVHPLEPESREAFQRMVSVYTFLLDSPFFLLRLLSGGLLPIPLLH